MNIIILGTHRSGTSMVAGILEHLGYHVGYDEELIGKGEENPKGFFERKDFRDINDEILHKNGFDWFKVADFSIDSLSEDSRKKYQSSAEKIISNLDAQGKWVVKEPRFCILYPLLKERTESAIKLVVFREPIETAESLWKRNEFPFYYGLALWEKYYNELFGSLSSDKLLVVNYNKLLIDPEEEINRLLNGINQISKSNLKNTGSAASFINKKLYRSQKYLALKDDYLSDSQKNILEQLNNFEIGHEFKQATGKLNYTVLKQSQHAEEIRIKSRSEKKQHDDIKKQLVNVEIRNEKLKQKISIYDKELINARRLIISKKSEIELIKSSLSWKLTKPLRYLSSKNPRLARLFDRYLRRTYGAVKQQAVQSRTKLESQDWCAPDDIGKKITRYNNELSKGKNKVALYTALYGGYDTLMLPDCLESDIDYICFTDNPANNFGVWQVRSAPYYHPDTTRIARYVKTHPHELLADYDIVVWIDSNIVLRGDVWKYINRIKNSDADIGLVSHPHRDCVYVEAEACKKLNKDQFIIIDEQIRRYRRETYPANAGMYETGFFVAKLNAFHIKDFFRIWWKEIDLYSKRDQLSVGWALTKSKIEMKQLMPNDTSVRDNVDFTIYPHDQARCLSVPKQLKKYSFLKRPDTGVSFADVKDVRLASEHDRPIDIVICVYNALEDVKLCLSSVIEHLSDAENIILVNDVSDDETTEYLRWFAENYQRVTLVENEENLGYTRSANRGLQSCMADFRIMLNSDTIVSKNWAQKMAAVAYMSDSIGIVGPLSNAAGSQSIPDIKGKSGQTAINKLPKGVKLADLDLACEKWSSADLFPRVPLVHGFCFAIKKAVIDNIGFFDDANFERYYGEENDYCFRAREAGFEFAIATNTFVYHRKSRSIEEEERLIHMDKAGQRLRELYGADNVSLACRQIADHPLLVELRNRASEYFNSRGH